MRKNVLKHDWLSYALHAKPMVQTEDLLVIARSFLKCDGRRRKSGVTRKRSNEEKQKKKKRGSNKRRSHAGSHLADRGHCLLPLVRQWNPATASALAEWLLATAHKQMQRCLISQSRTSIKGRRTRQRR